MALNTFTKDEHADLLRICSTLDREGNLRTPAALLPSSQSNSRTLAALVAQRGDRWRPDGVHMSLEDLTFLIGRAISKLRGIAKSDIQQAALSRPDAKPLASKEIPRLNAFPKFSELALELRLLVWEVLIPKVRVIEVGTDRNSISGTKTAHWDLFQLRPTCKESKGVVEKKYQVLHARSIPWPGMSQSEGDSIVLFDGTTDIIYQPNNFYSHLLLRLTPAQRLSIRSIAVSSIWSSVALGSSGAEHTKNWFDSLPNLRKLIWVFGETDTRDQGTGLELIAPAKSSIEEQRKDDILKLWKSYVARNENSEALCSIEIVFREVRRTNPRQILSREIRELVAKEQKQEQAATI